MTEDAGEVPAKKKGSKGYPPGILEHRSGKLQARLPGVKVEGKSYQRPIPGLYKELEDAVAAQTAALQLFESGGVEAVWPVASTERNERGKVRASKCPTVNPVPTGSSLIARASIAVHLQGSKRKQLATARLEEKATKPKGVSHQSKGVGRGSNGHGPNGKFVRRDGEQRDPQLPTTVPMPHAVEDITDAGMRAMWEAEGSKRAPPIEPLDE